MLSLLSHLSSASDHKDKLLFLCMLCPANLFKSHQAYEVMITYMP